MVHCKILLQNLINSFNLPISMEMVYSRQLHVNYQNFEQKLQELGYKLRITIKDDIVKEAIIFVDVVNKKSYCCFISDCLVT